MKLLKHIFFILFFLVFLGEFIQNYEPFIKSKPLKGGITLNPKPLLTLDDWMSGLYQECEMKYFEDNIDLHTFLIRLNNQVDYSLFGKIHADRVVEGRDKVLYDEGYIQAYLGRDFVGNKYINDKVGELKYVQTELKKRNIDLLFVITSGKASIYPEYFPERYNDSAQKTRSNCDAYAEAFEREKINYIDTRKVLLKFKPLTKYPLFPRTGVHWSGYAATITADTLLKRMEQLHAMDMEDYYYDGGDISDTTRYSDADIGEAMNLLHDIAPYKMYYPKLVYKKDSTKTKPNVLLVGDSFIWTWLAFYNYIPEMFSNKSAFWYYSKEVQWPLNPEQGPYKVETLNFKEQTLSRDFILIIYNDYTLVNGDYGFTDKMYEMLKADTL